MPARSARLATTTHGGTPRPAVNVDNLQSCTRTWFGWANAMLVALVESGMGVDCTASAERQRLARVQVCHLLAAASIGGAVCAPGQLREPRVITPQHVVAPQDREAKDATAKPTNGGGDDPLYYETLEATVAFDRDSIELPSYVGGSVQPV